MQTAEDFVEASNTTYPKTLLVAMVAARDAEWQARVERLRTGLSKAQDRIDVLMAALEECVEYIQRTDKVNPMEALYQGEGYSKDVLPLINKICAALEAARG